MTLTMRWVAARQGRDGAWRFCRDRMTGSWTEDVTQALVFDQMADAAQVGEAMPWALAMQVAYSDPHAAEAAS